jgi:beta-lactamase class A
MRTLSVGALLAALVTGPGTAQSPALDADTAALARLFRAPVRPDALAPSFAQQVPAAQLQAIVDQLTRQLGPLRRVRPSGEPGRYVLELERGEVPALVRLDATGRLAGLLFQPPRPALRTWAQIDSAARALPGRAAVLVRVDGRDRLALAADSPRAVGSAFKLAILAALADEIANGRRRWSDVVALRPEWKSLPSGLLQDWPDGTPLTLATLATLMIAVSDNTAADALLALVGRAAVERYAPYNRPFLATREAFVLKDPTAADLWARYRAADLAGRRALLPALAARPLPAPSIFAGAPRAIDVEWFFTARELCGLLERLDTLPVFAVNPGVADRREWRRVAFKGGSEPGVLNLSTYAVAPDGRRVCVVATWNRPDGETDLLTLSGLVRAALRLAREEPR